MVEYLPKTIKQYLEIYGKCKKKKKSCILFIICRKNSTADKLRLRNYLFPPLSLQRGN